MRWDGHPKRETQKTGTRVGSAMQPCRVVEDLLSGFPHLRCQSGSAMYDKVQKGLRQQLYPDRKDYHGPRFLLAGFFMK